MIIVEKGYLEDKIEHAVPAEVDSVVFYRLPFKKDKVVHAGKAFLLSDLADELLNKDGFVIHPFNRTETDLIWVDKKLHYNYTGNIEEGLSSQLICKFETQLDDSNSRGTDFDSYREQFGQMHQAILDGKLDKVILSKQKMVEPFNVTSVITVFDELCELYSHAFVYALVTPYSGVWIGAGPEVLLRKEAGMLHTIALAGTLPNIRELAWNEKERVEQDWVTRYLKDVLNQNGVEKFECEGPYSAEAGQVKHLRTDFRFTSGQLTNNIAELLQQLHPTPAVCGMPKSVAIDLITKAETHKREYYAGYLGPVNKGDFSFFVNIRCLKLTRLNAVLYLGGGLTAGSVLNNEWEETELKAQTLLSVLKNITNLQGYE